MQKHYQVHNDIASSDFQNDKNKSDEGRLGSRPSASMKEAFVLFWKRWRDFRGCSSRREYWKMVLWEVIVVSVILLIYYIRLFHVLFTGDLDIIHLFSTVGLTGELQSLSVIIDLVMLIPSVAMTVRRSRDAGYTKVTAIILVILSFLPLLRVVKWVAMIAPSNKHKF